MDAGTMDPETRANTNIGRILGMITSILLILGMILAILSVGFLVLTPVSWILSPWLKTWVLLGAVLSTWHHLTIGCQGKLYSIFLVRLEINGSPFAGRGVEADC